MPDSLDLPTIARDPDGLNQLSLVELRALWGRCCPKSSPSPHRGMLIRDLASVAQSGGTRWPRETDALIRAAMKTTSVTRSLEDKPARMCARLPAPKAVQDLPPGAVLTREWSGQSHQVTVLGGGWFQYQGQSYKSLTLVAKAITGAHWSGPRFFGLHRFREQRHG
ncbi:MAG TPA: DUF2924 domain-containing protein [Pseudomonadales bacterium]|nr:DUF2924 domain-containing protein [Pseudomonadales bacterium]